MVGKTYWRSPVWVSSLGLFLGSLVIGSSVKPVQAREDLSRYLLPTPVPTMAETTVLQGEDWSAVYRLGYGDFLGVTVLGADEYGGEVIVGQDGSVNLPQIGRVFVRGLTLQQATAAIATEYAVFIHEPIVNITPLRFRPVRIGIAGEIKRPGAYVMTGENDFSSSDIRDFGFPTLTQAIDQAGGITSQANLRTVEIRREIGQGQQQTLTIDLWALIQAGDLQQDITLMGGDEVFIPTATSLTPEEVTLLSSANFAPDTIRVYVAGEVNAPGVVEVPLNTPLNQALLAAGGFTPRSRENTVELVRLNPNGSASQTLVEIDFSVGVDAIKNPVLSDQDVIIVHPSAIAKVGDFTGILLNPFTTIIDSLFGASRLLRSR